MTKAEMVQRLREWAREIRVDQGNIYPEVDLDGLQVDLDTIATALEEEVA